MPQAQTGTQATDPSYYAAMSKTIGVADIKKIYSRLVAEYRDLGWYDKAVGTGFFAWEFGIGGADRRANDAWKVAKTGQFDPNLPIEVGGRSVPKAIADLDKSKANFDLAYNALIGADRQFAKNPDNAASASGYMMAYANYVTALFDFQSRVQQMDQSGLKGVVNGLNFALDAATIPLLAVGAGGLFTGVKFAVSESFAQAGSLMLRNLPKMAPGALGYAGIVASKDYFVMKDREAVAKKFMADAPTATTRLLGELSQLGKMAKDLQMNDLAKQATDLYWNVYSLSEQLKNSKVNYASLATSFLAYFAIGMALSSAFSFGSAARRLARYGVGSEGLKGKSLELYLGLAQGLETKDPGKLKSALGITGELTMENLNQRYRVLMKSYHPKGAPGEDAVAMGKLSSQLSQAKKMLQNQIKSGATSSTPHVSALPEPDGIAIQKGSGEPPMMKRVNGHEVAVSPEQGIFFLPASKTTGKPQMQPSWSFLAKNTEPVFAPGVLAVSIVPIPGGKKGRAGKGQPSKIEEKPVIDNSAHENAIAGSSAKRLQSTYELTDAEAIGIVKQVRAIDKPYVFAGSTGDFVDMAVGAKTGIFINPFFHESEFAGRYQKDIRADLEEHGAAAIHFESEGNLDQGGRMVLTFTLDGEKKTAIFYKGYSYDLFSKINPPELKDGISYYMTVHASPEGYMFTPEILSKVPIGGYISGLTLTNNDMIAQELLGFRIVKNLKSAGGHTYKDYCLFQKIGDNQITRAKLSFLANMTSIDANSRLSGLNKNANSGEYSLSFISPGAEFEIVRKYYDQLSASEKAIVLPEIARLSLQVAPKSMFPHLSKEKYDEVVNSYEDNAKKFFPEIAGQAQKGANRQKIAVPKPAIPSAYEFVDANYKAKKGEDILRVYMSKEKWDKLSPEEQGLKINEELQFKYWWKRGQYSSKAPVEKITFKTENGNTIELYNYMRKLTLSEVESLKKAISFADGVDNGKGIKSAQYIVLTGSVKPNSLIASEYENGYGSLVGNSGGPDGIMLHTPSFESGEVQGAIIPNTYHGLAVPKVEASALHELGHHAWANNYDLHQEWSAISNWKFVAESYSEVPAENAKFVSQYAKNNPQEDFCDSFMAWKFGLKELPPEKADFFNRHFGKLQATPEKISSTTVDGLKAKPPETPKIKVKIG